MSQLSHSYLSSILCLLHGLPLIIWCEQITAWNMTSWNVAFVLFKIEIIAPHIFPLNPSDLPYIHKSWLQSTYYKEYKFYWKKSIF